MNEIAIRAAEEIERLAYTVSCEGGSTISRITTRFNGLAVQQIVERAMAKAVVEKLDELRGCQQAGGILGVLMDNTRSLKKGETK